MNKRKSIIIMLILFLVVGFASVSATLVLNGILAISENKDDFIIIFTNAKLNGVNRNNFISEDKKHIGFKSNELKSLDDKAILTYEVTNTSRNYDADVQVTCSAGFTDLITFEYTPHEMEVLAGEKKTGTLTASMFKVVEESKEVPIECTLTGTAKPRESLGEEFVPPFNEAGTLMVAALDEGTNPTDKFWLYASNITKVIFEDKFTEHTGEDIQRFDVSDAQDDSVRAYLEKNGEEITITEDVDGNEITDKTAYNLYIQGNTGVKANSNSFGLFAYFYNLKTIENLNYLDTSNVESMDGMFYCCQSLTSLDLSSFDTRNVTIMSMMFGYCESLLNLDIGSFDTSKVTTMTSMFEVCNNLSYLDVSSFDTNNVTDMSYMFCGTIKLTTLNLSNFDTSNVINMDSMFTYCQKLINIDISNFNTSNVTNMAGMFWGCSSLVSLDVSSFNTSKVTDMSCMFEDCEKLTDLDVNNFNTANTTSMQQMFRGCQKLTSLNISHFDTSNVTTMQSMFSYCISLTSIDMHGLNTEKTTNMVGMFSQCYELTNVNLDGINTSNVTTMEHMFSNCSKLKNLDISSFDISKVTDTNFMFYFMPSDAIVKVANETVQNKLLTIDTDRPSAWTTENIVIKEAA